MWRGYSRRPVLFRALAEGVSGVLDAQRAPAVGFQDNVLLCVEHDVSVCLACVGNKAVGAFRYAVDDDVEEALKEWG